VLQREIAFLPSTFAFERSVRNLREVDTVLPELAEGCMNPVQKWMVQCSLCDKWRFASKLVHDRYGNDGVDFQCSNLGVSCGSKEDIRVWEEYEDWEVAESREDLQVVIIDEDRTEKDIVAADESVESTSPLVTHPFVQRRGLVAREQGPAQALKALVCRGDSATLSTDEGSEGSSDSGVESDCGNEVEVVGRSAICPVSQKEVRDFDEGLINQFRRQWSTDEIVTLQRMAAQECKDEVVERVCAFVVVVKNRCLCSYESGVQGVGCCVGKRGECYRRHGVVSRW